MDVMFSRVHGKIEKISENVTMDYQQFAHMNYSYKWTAGRFDINRIDLLKDQIMKITEKGLFRMILTINLKYTETGD